MPWKWRRDQGQGRGRRHRHRHRRRRRRRELREIFLPPSPPSPHTQRHLFIQKRKRRGGKTACWVTYSLAEKSPLIIYSSAAGRVTAIPHPQWQKKEGRMPCFPACHMKKKTSFFSPWTKGRRWEWLTDTGKKAAPLREEGRKEEEEESNFQFWQEGGRNAFLHFFTPPPSFPYQLLFYNSDTSTA